MPTIAGPHVRRTIAILGSPGVGKTALAAKLGGGHGFSVLSEGPEGNDTVVDFIESDLEPSPQVLMTAHAYMFVYSAEDVDVDFDVPRLASLATLTACCVAAAAAVGQQ